ncbi:MAG: AMP-binding protein, partial [Acidimicrobiales bacterium]|nr:AMP-binding protein [Acidimicrobiales bacterium]
MTRLVALDLAGGPEFVAALQRTWDRGDAAFVVDRRLPESAKRDLLRTVRPHAIVADDGSSSRRSNPIAPSLEPGDALVVATSGSTGSPKLVVHTFAGLEVQARAVHSRLEVAPGRDRWLACLPLSHLGGLGVVIRSLLTGTPVDVIDGFDGDFVDQAPERLGSTLISLVPTALDRVDTSRYRWVVLGGAADPGDRASNVVRTYGLTETGGGVVFGGVPLDGVEVAVDADGAIRLRGPMLARGRRLEDGTVEPLTDEDGWLHTGDQGRWDEGRLVVHGRHDDLIVSGGENVWPTPVERALSTHPSVAEAAVVGVADPQWGQRVVAVVVPTDPG